MIVYDVEAIDDLERIFEFNAARDPASAAWHVEVIRNAVLILDTHPEIGRRVHGSPLRELVISRGGSGYVALYGFFAEDDLVRVVAIRHQREAGYRG